MVKATLIDRIVIWIGALGVIAPVLYLVTMIQYSAITFPFWDHVSIADYVIRYFDGTLTFRGLLEAHNQARPLFPRFILVANAVLTDWDIRSEYIFIYATVFGTLGALLWALRSLSRDWPRPAVYMVAALLSILACSPVGANNHYWSLMLIATLANLCATLALLMVALRPLSWSANSAAAILTWMATYSNSPGLFLFPVLVVLHQLIASNRWRPNRFSVFWAINLVVCYAVYIPGISLRDGSRPTLVDFLVFIPVYIGNPLGSLLWFEGWFAHTHTIWINGLCGVAILTAVAFTAWRVMRELPAQRPEVLIFLSFTGFAAACALTTAWGRANGEYPIAMANSSRYSIFSVYFLFGLIFYYAPQFARRSLHFGGVYKVLLAAFFIAAGVSYDRGIGVYTTSRGYNDWLAAIYLPRGAATDDDLRAYPDLDFMRRMRAGMVRLGLGPYRSIPEVTAPIFAGSFLAAVPILPNRPLVQRFKLERPVLHSVSFPVVFWGLVPSPNTIRWTASGQRDGKPVDLGKGSFSTVGLTDWKTVTLKLNRSEQADEVEIKFDVDGGDVERPLGLALYPPSKADAPALLNDVVAKDNLVVGLTAVYEK